MLSQMMITFVLSVRLRLIYGEEIYVDIILPMLSIIYALILGQETEAKTIQLGIKNGKSVSQ